MFRISRTRCSIRQTKSTMMSTVSKSMILARAMMWCKKIVSVLRCDYDSRMLTQPVVPALPYAETFVNLFHLNDTFLADVRARDQSCGYAAFRDKYLTFPPAPGGHYPMPPNNSVEGCSIWSDIIDAVTLFNPCFDGKLPSPCSACFSKPSVFKSIAYRRPVG